MAKILVFGATGRVGKAFCLLAVEAGHEVTGFVRKPEHFAVEGCGVIQGDVMQPDQVTKAIGEADYDYIIIAIGPRTVHAKIRTSSVGTANIIKAVGDRLIKRIWAVGGAGILQYHDQKLVSDLHSYPPQLKTITDEHLKAWKALENSSLPFTIICPGYMPTGQPTGIYKTQFNQSFEGISQINTGDVAHYLVHNLDNAESINKRVAISY